MSDIRTLHLSQLFFHHITFSIRVPSSSSLKPYMATTAPRQNSRLRLACDNCSAAKVKCDKKQPVCDRCANNDLAQCTYSISRRYGKLSYAKKAACEREKAAAAVAAQARPMMRNSHEIDTPMNAIPALLPNEQLWDRGVVPFDGMNVGMDGLAPSWSDFDLAYLDSEASTTIVPSINVSYNTCGIENGISSQPMVEHDCEARAISVLRSLQHYSAGPTENTPRLPGVAALTNKSPVLDSELVPSFDKVLKANKSALDEWGGLMRCPCAQCPALAFLYVSILWKVLFWYRVAATENGGTEASSTSQLVPLPNVGHFGVRATSVQVGVFDLGPEDQVSIRRVVLRGELRKFEKAVAEMESMNASSEDRHRPAQWCSLGIPQINVELQDLFQMIQ